MRPVARGHCSFVNAAIHLVIGATLLHDGVGNGMRQLADTSDRDPDPVARSGDPTGRGLDGVYQQLNLSRGNSCSRGSDLHICGDDSRGALTLPAGAASMAALGASRRVYREKSMTSSTTRQIWRDASLRVATVEMVHAWRR